MLYYPPPYLTNEGLLSRVTINITKRCNLSCKYCLRDSGPNYNAFLSFKTVRKILDYFVDKNENTSHQLVVQLTGGEIFLHEDIFEIIKYAVGLNYVVRLQTNGTLLCHIAEDTLNGIIDANVIFKVSLDGWSEDINCQFRGKDSYFSALKGIERIRNKTSNIGLRTVIHNGNFNNIHKMLDLCNDLNVESWAHNLFRKRGRCKNESEYSELDVVKKLIPYYNRKRYKQLLGGSNVLVYHLMNLFNIVTRPYYFFIDADGLVYLTDCTDPQYQTGSIFNGSFDELFDIRRVPVLPDMEVDKAVLSYVSEHLDI